MIAVSFYLFGRYSNPNKSLSVSQIKAQTRIETILNVVDKGTVHEKEIKRPDGTTEVERITVYDKSQTNQTINQKESESIKIKKTENSPNNQLVLMYRLDSNSSDQISKRIKVGYQFRILNNLYFGGYVAPTSSPEYGLVLSLGL